MHNHNEQVKSPEAKLGCADTSISNQFLEKKSFEQTIQ
jgi:hypothetical protein